MSLVETSDLLQGPEALLAEHQNPAEAAARLEQALERIARAARAPGTPAADTTEIAARLDRLIGELRAALGTTPGG